MYMYVCEWYIIECNFDFQGIELQTPKYAECDNHRVKWEKIL